MEIFCSCAGVDKKLKDHLKSHLSLLIRDGVIFFSHDRDIDAGADWKKAIAERLSRADIILLLVSADYFRSDYCIFEMERALKRHLEGNARVIPVILRPCEWQQSPCKDLNCLPTKGKPITLWPNRDQAFQNVAEGIRGIILTLKGQASHATGPIMAPEIRPQTRYRAKFVLVGEPDLHRFERLKQIISDASGLEAVQAKTFLRLVEDCKAMAHELALVLFTETLPYSDEEKSVLLSAAMRQFIEVRLTASCAALVGVVYQNEAPLHNISDNECDFFFCFPDSEENLKIFREGLQAVLGVPSRSGSGRARAAESGTDS